MTQKPESKLWEKLLGGVRSAVELNILTYVGEVAVSGPIDSPKIEFSPDKGSAIVTSINLAAGDITSVVPDKFWAPDQDVIREYHQQQVEQGKAIVERNLRLISELGAGLADSLKQLKQIEG